MLEVAPGWTIDVQRGPDWLYVRLRVAASHWSDVTGLAESIWNLLRQQFTHRLVLELDELTCFPSSLMGELVRLYKRIQANDGLMRLCGLSQANLDALHLTRLERCFPHYESREDAVMGIRRSRPR